jgi:hypothetical protein
MGAPSPFLPQPRRERWQPLRSGIVNLYRYDCEEFHYEDGRLLLRGNNGTGKSRVLALQLPFLFDGEVTPERLEPDADPSKKIEWNLLMSRYPDRTGYTWIEFGRREENGAEHYLTLGCGLHAVEGKSGVRQWFFITSQRVGRELDLVTNSQRVINKERLEAQLGSAGRVIEGAGAYRRAVNEALFQLDEYRYASLLNLLIQLRRPQLTRRLEESDLSRALSEALPPVSRTAIENVAEAFRSLESDRDQLDRSRSALAAVEEFLGGYSVYAAIAAKRCAQRVLNAHNDYEHAMRELLTAEADCDRSLAELARLKADMQRLSAQERAIQAEIAVFQQNPEKKDAQALDHFQRELEERRRDAAAGAAELADSSRVRQECSEEHRRLEISLEQCQARVRTALEEAEVAARFAGLEKVHRECFPSIHLAAADPAAWKDIEQRIAAIVQEQVENCRHLARLQESVLRATQDLQRVRSERDYLHALIEDAQERLNGAREEHQNAVTNFLADVATWTADLAELPLPFDEAFLSSVSEWCDHPQGPNPFAVAGRNAVEELSIHFADTRAHLKHLEKERTAELNRLEQEYESLRASDLAGTLNEPQRLVLSQLETRIEELQRQLDPIIDSIADLNRRHDVLRNESRAVPHDEPVWMAYDYSVAVARHLDRLTTRFVEAEDRLSQQQQQFEQATAARDSAGTDLGLAGWVTRLPELEQGILGYRLALSSLFAGLHSVQEVKIAGARMSWHLEQASARETRQKELVRELEGRVAAAETACRTAAESVGSSHTEIVRRLAAARERLEHVRASEKEARGRYHDTEVAVTRVDERLRSRTAVLNGDTDRRETAAASMRALASTELIRLALPEFDPGDGRHWSTTRTMEVALELSSRLESVDAADLAWEYHQKSVSAEFTRVMQTLSAQGWKSSALFRDELFVARAMSAGEECGIAELRKILLDDVETRQLRLRVKSKEIFEEHLIGQLSRQLRGLMLAADEQVRTMNVELESRPMSTGMKLRFVWRPSEVAPANFPEVRQLLMQPSDDWSAAEQEILGTFLQHQIAAVLTDADTVSWQESLADALDYRNWHWFGVERCQDGVWKRLTRRTHGTGSGGEKAVALTLPHFAAAAAFYRSAGPLAPRLILLDEAFVGIDADMRSKCMGLIHVFDLDFMMTSEREWGCYPTVPGIAIYHLSTRPGIDAVGMTRWVWNGRQRALVPEEKLHLERELVEH